MQPGPLLVLAVACAAALTSTASAQSTAPERDEPAGRDRAWLLAGAGLGGGSRRLGPILAQARVDAHAWLLEPFGVSIGAGIETSGAPGYRGASGSFILGALDARFALDRTDAPTWLMVSVGAGLARVSGYDDTRAIERTRFEATRFAWTGRMGVVGARGVIRYGGAVVVQGALAQGVAIAPTLVIGAGF